MSYVFLALVGRGDIALCFTHSNGFEPTRNTLRVQSSIRPPISAKVHINEWAEVRFSRSMPSLRIASTPTTADFPAKSSRNWTKQNLAIGVPALIGMLADPLLSLMDTAYVGHLGSIELAALGSCTSIFHLSFNTFRATTAATTSLIATALQESEEEARSVTSISLGLGIGLGLALFATLFAFGNFGLRAMGISHQAEQQFAAAASYLFTRAWSAPAVLFIVVAEGVFRGYGNTMIPLTASLAAALINLVLDPVLMFQPIAWGVAGAAAATAISQIGAAAVYLNTLIRRKMLPQNKAGKSTPTSATTSKIPTMNVVRSILGANAAMLSKQGSLLLGWTIATQRATKLGPTHVAAHQVGLTVWLVFALIMDGAAVSAQVLMSRSYAKRDKKEAASLIQYMIKFAFLQGLASMLVVNTIDKAVPTLFTRDPVIQGHLHKLMPHLALQQILVSLTLVIESLAVGGNQFRILAAGTMWTTVVAVWQISQQNSVHGIWGVGIVTLFSGRLLTACYGTWRAFCTVDRHKTLVQRDTTYQGT